MADIKAAAIPLKRSWPRNTITILILLFAGGAAYWVSARPLRSAGAQEVLTVDPKFLEIGEVWQQMGLPWKITIENPHDKDVEILDFATTCGCVQSIEPRSLVVPARGTAEVRLVLNIFNPKARSNEKPSGYDFSLQLTPRLEDAWPQQGPWVLHGTARPVPLNVSPRLVDFADGLVHGQQFETRWAELSSELSVSRLDFKCDSSVLDVQVMRVSEKPDKFKLGITPKEQLRSGPFSSLVRLSAVTPDGRKIPAAVLVEGKVVDDIFCEPDLVLFGARRLEETPEETVVLQSRSRQPFQVIKVQTDDAKVSVQLVGKPAAYAYKYKVRQKVAALGDQSGKVTFSVRGDRERRAFELQLRTSYHGMCGE
jgi:hypothetical protein